MEFVFETLFQTNFAEMLRTSIIRQFPICLEFFKIFVVNPAYVADYVRGRYTLRIVAKKTRVDVYPGKSKPIGGKTRHLNLTQPSFDRQGLKAMAIVAQFFEPLAIP